MEKLVIRTIIEMIGKPKEHLIDSIEKHVNNISNEEGIKIIGRKFHEPTKIEGTNEMFSTFTEIEIELSSLNGLFSFIFKYMPSNIEIVSPQNIELKNDELSMLSNFITTRMHDYDSITKKLIGDKDYILRQLKKYAPHLFKYEQQAGAIPGSILSSPPKLTIKKSKNKKKSNSSKPKQKNK